MAPHLIFFLADDAGWNDVGFTRGVEAPTSALLGPQAKTPAIDALAREGIILQRSYAYRYCSPSRASLLTGRIPAHVHEANPGMGSTGCTNLNYTMLPALLSQVGYRSYHVGKWHQGFETHECVPYRRGFRGGSFGFLGGAEDHVDQTNAAGLCNCTESSGGCVDLWRDERPATGENGTYNGYSFTDEAVRIIEHHNRTEPMFLFAAWQAVHGPYEVPSRFRALFPADASCPAGPAMGSPDCCGWTERSALTPCNVASSEAVCKCPSEAMPFQPPSGMRCPPGAQCTRLYLLAMLAALDEAVGNVTAALRRVGLYDDSVIAFSSDNGGPVGDCDHFDDGCQLGSANNFPLREVGCLEQLATPMSDVATVPASIDGDNSLAWQP